MERPTAQLVCEGSCSVTRGRNGHAPMVTAHHFRERQPGLLKLTFAEKHPDVHGVRLLYACSRCGHRRTWGVEEE